MIRMTGSFREEYMGKNIRGTEEWAETNLNFQKGCRNDCVYCYAKAMAIRFGTAIPESWKEPVMAMPERFPKEKLVMMPSSHDIDRKNTSYAAECLKRLLDNNNRVLIVTKPRAAAIGGLISVLTSAPYSAKKDMVTFRLSISTADEVLLRRFEPDAPDFHERLMALRELKLAGLRAGVSAEPLLGGYDTFRDLYARVKPFLTDEIWVGKLNQGRQRIHMNTGGAFDEALIDQILNHQSDSEMLRLYEAYKDDPLMRFKDSIMNIVKGKNSGRE